jgi:hypothetical protein
MSCGCNNSGSELPTQNLTSNLTPAYTESIPGDCESTNGKFYDKTTDSFVVPQVGKESYIFVCEANRWMIGQYVAVDLGNNTIAAFKITGRTSKKIKVLNGCDRSGNNPILDNPDPGTVIPVGSTIYAIAPYGCSSGDAQRIIRILETYGVDAILDIIQDSTAICFNNVPAVSEEEEVHLFAGTRPDCDCAPGGFISSCLRKVLKIFTGQAGRTLCMPEAANININDNEDNKIAIFDENGCIKKGPTYNELKSCENLTSIGKGESFNFISVCNDGISSGLSPSEKYLEVTTEEVDDPNSENPSDKITRWVSKEKRYAVILDEKPANVNGGNGVSGSWQKRDLNRISQQSDGLVSLNSSEFTILKSGMYEIDFCSVFFAPNDFQIRIENVDDSNEVYHSTSGFGNFETGAVNALAHGSAIVEVVTTKKFRLSYRVQTASTNRLGTTNSWGPNIYSIVKIKSI